LELGWYTFLQHIVVANCYIRLLYFTIRIAESVVFLVKEGKSANEKLHEVERQQKSVMSDQLLHITKLRQDLTATRSALSQLQAACECHDIENDQLISSLRLQLHAVSIDATSM